MRFAVLFLSIISVFSTGCTMFVVNSGQYLGSLKNREEVHKAFGEPSSTSQTDKKLTEEFLTHRKIAERYKNIYLCMGYVWTQVNYSRLFPVVGSVLSEPD